MFVSSPTKKDTVKGRLVCNIINQDDAHGSSVISCKVPTSRLLDGDDNHDKITMMMINTMMVMLNDEVEDEHHDGDAK